MGYSGLLSPANSDNASDLKEKMYSDIYVVMYKTLNEGLKLKDNQSNTDGVVNVGLILEEYLKIDEELLMNKNMFKLVNRVCDRLSKLIKKTKKELWEDGYEKRSHIKAYERILQTLIIKSTISLREDV